MKKLILLSNILIFLTQVTAAQDSTLVLSSKKKQSYLTDTRNWTIEIPIWIPGFRGEFAYGDIGIEGEDGTDLSPENPIEKPGFGDAFKRLFKTGWNLNYFFVTNVAYHKGKFYGELDAFSGTVGAHIKFRYNNKKLVNAQFHSDLARIAGGYQLAERWTNSDKARYRLWAYGGARLHNFNIKSELSGINKSLHVDPLWVEPLLGVKNEFSLDYWKFIVQADMGSFGINDKFSYMLNAYAFYRISNLLSVKVGWNTWHSKYNDRFKNEDLFLKVHLAGPAASLKFSF